MLKLSLFILKRSLPTAKQPLRTSELATLRLPGVKLRNLVAFLSLISAFGLLCETSAFAEDAIIGVPSLMTEGPNLTLHQLVIGRACYSMAASVNDIDCNPAFLADSQKRVFRANLVANDQAKNFADAYRGLRGDDAVSIADSLLVDHQPRQAQAATSIWYQHDYWAVGIVPIRTGLSYLSRNEAYPQLSVYGTQETEVFYKVGLLSEDDKALKIGLQSRYVVRRYIYQKFYALDALADPDVIELHDQRVLYVEPGFSYEFSSAWKPTLSAMITNLPIYRSGDRLPSHPEFDLGLGTSYQGLLPHFRSTTHYHRAAGRELGQAFSWSGIYDIGSFGAASVTAGYGLFGAGIDGRIAMVNLGIGYRRERIDVDAWNKKSVESTFVQLGFNF